MLDGLVSAVFIRGETEFEIVSIPAVVCPECGDAVVKEEVALNLLQGLDELFSTGVKDGKREFRML